jgi:16S rRNA (guanine527-N7)-methyltransferase
VEHLAAPAAASLPAPSAPGLPPGVARAVFGERLDLAQAYVARLGGDAVVRGLIGPRERDRLWERHVLNCAVLAPLIPEGATVADLGSGAGLPGIVLALARPDLEIDLVEPLERRSTFLQEVVDELALSRCRVVRARAEALADQSGFGRAYDVVTARALAPLDRLLGWARPLVRPAGQVLALKGATAANEVAAASRQLQAWSDVEVLTLISAAGEPTWVVRAIARESAS